MKKRANFCIASTKKKMDKTPSQKKYDDFGRSCFLFFFERGGGGGGGGIVDDCLALKSCARNLCCFLRRTI
jgi:hypothetical protein